MLRNSSNKNGIGGFNFWNIVALAIVYGYAALPFNTAPLIISTLIQSFHINEASAGLIVSAELISIALTTMLISAKIDKLPLIKLIIVGTVILTITNILSALPDSLTLLFVIRIAAGIAAGVIITCIYYLVGISSEPVRLFGILMVGNVILGALFLGLLPLAIDFWYYRGAFVLTATPMLVIVFLLPKIGFPEVFETKPSVMLKKQFGWLSLLFIFGVFIVQAAQGGSYAFVEQIGLRLSIAPETIGLALAGSYVLSLGGAAIASIMGDRFGVLKPLFVGMLGFAIATYFVVFATSEYDYLIPLFPQALFFFLFLPYMLGLAANLDHSGHLSTLTGGVVMLGLGVGPFISGSMVETVGYSSIAYNVIISVIVCYLLMVYVSRRMSV